MTAALGDEILRRWGNATIHSRMPSSRGVSRSRDLATILAVTITVPTGVLDR